jgi:hypothetical protein
MLPRKQAFEALPEWSPCARCGKPMWKHSKDKLGRSALHYDHAEDGTYLGFSHGSCNRAAGAAKGGHVAIEHRKPARFTRDCTTCGKTFRAWTEEQTRCSHKCRRPPRPKQPAVQLQLPLGRPVRPAVPCCPTCGRRMPTGSCRDCMREARLRQRLTEVASLIDAGMTNTRIAALTGIPVGSVSRMVRFHRHGR